MYPFVSKDKSSTVACRNSYKLYTVVTLGCFFSRSQWGHTGKSARLPRASVAASSQTQPMVDGGWGVLQDPNTIWVGHHLGFRAFGLAASPNRGRRLSSLRITRMEVLRVHREYGP